MLGTFLKRKLSNEKVANIFVNTLIDVLDNGFKEVAGLINDDPAFESHPDVKENQNGEFDLIVIAGNLSFLESTFDSEQADAVGKLIFEKLGKIYGVTQHEFEALIRKYQSFINHVNAPSKNMIYGMSKAIFHKYKLNEFQNEYFYKMQAPNPLFLKRMDEVVTNFIWDWDAFFKKYKI